MKNNNWFVPVLALTLAVLVTAGCGASSQVAATPAEIDNTVPAATATLAATATPEPMPDLTTARISLDELPAGFEEIPMDEADLREAIASDEGLEPGVIFAYVNSEEFQVIFGMNFLLVDAVDKLGFQFALNQPELTLKEFAGAMGSVNIRNEMILDSMEEVGDSRIAMTMLSDVEDVPMRVNVAMFQRDTVGAMILSMTMEGKSEIISLQELGSLFDQHIQDSLNTIE